MANESVPQANQSEPIGRCKHDVELVNEISERVLKMKAVVDLMLCSRAGDLAGDTLNNTGWLLFDMLSEIKEIVCERQEVTA